jgi:peptidoglycan/xylan/chitin deacetylase (PgdA/CDA1 family)
MFRSSALAVTVAATLLAMSAAAHAAECENPDALGVSRTLEVDPAALPKIGTMSYHDGLPLNDHEIVITFDDGPLPAHTEKILEILAAQCVKATYFMVGRMASAYPEAVRKVAAAGHTIGTHSQNHPWFTRLSPAKAKDEIDQGFTSVQTALGEGYKVAPFFRFPGLLHRADAEAYLAERGVMVWSVDFHGDDWHHRISPQEIVKRVMTRLAANHNRGVLLLHDIHARTEAALPDLLAQLKEQGYKVVHAVPATELKPAPSPETPVASASPDGTGLPAAATNPAAARHAVPAAVAAASVAADGASEAGAPNTTKAAPVLADHPPRASSLRKRLVLRNNNHKAFARRLAVARPRQGTQARFAAAHAHLPPARGAAVARLTRAHAALTPPRRAVLLQRAHTSAKPIQACANCRLVPAKRVHPASPRA